MAEFIDCYVVTRTPDTEVMAVFTDEGDARDYVEECYREDFFEYDKGDDDAEGDAYDRYREYSVYDYQIEKKPLLVKG